MSHFAELNGSNIVQRVIVVADADCLDESNRESEAVGIAFCQGLFGGSTIWKQTSYNTRGGTHTASGTPFRKNYAGIGYTYDSGRDAFIPPQPFPSWTLNGATCYWECPLAYPNDDQVYRWDESAYQSDNTTGWVKEL